MEFIEFRTAEVPNDLPMTQAIVDRVQTASMSTSAAEASQGIWYAINGLLSVVAALEAEVNALRYLVEGDD